MKKEPRSAPFFVSSRRHFWQNATCFPHPFLRSRWLSVENGDVRAASCSLRHRPHHPGFLLIEAILGTSLLVIFLGALGMTIFKGEQGTKAGGDRIRATKLAEQTFEGARDLATRNFGPGANSLTSAVGAGTKGMALNASGVWTLSGSQTVSNGYTTKMTVTQPDVSDATVLDVSVTTSWNISPNRAQTVTLNGRLVNWKGSEPTGNWSGISQLGQYLNSGGNYSCVAIIGNYAYLGSSSSNTITVLQNVNTPGSLSLAGTFTVGSSGDTTTAIVAKGNLLYILTTDSSAELKTYDTTPGATSPVAGPTYNVVLTGLTPASIAVAGDFLFLGAQ